MKLQSGAIPFLSIDGILHLVLITSHSTGGWILPKGSIEPGMSIEESAANEALEEAGVAGEIGDTEIASYRYIKYSTLHVVAMYALAVEEVHDEWDEMHSRERQIVSLELAVEMVEENVAPVITAFRDWIAKNQGFSGPEPSA